MCGRYVVTKPVFKTEKIVKKTIGVENDDNYNAHPQQKLPVIKQYTNGKTLEGLEWGMTPSWTKEKDGTIRKLYGISIDKNSVHGSDSPENAKAEIDFFFN